MIQNCLPPAAELEMQEILSAVEQFRKTNDPFYLDYIHCCTFKARDKADISSMTDDFEIRKALQLSGCWPNRR